MKFLIILFLMVLSTTAEAKIRILTFHYNKPDFIELQYKTFKKFMQNDYELIVFNDANTPEREEAIKEMCEKYGILCIRYEPSWHFNDPLNEKIAEWLSMPLVTSHIKFNHVGIPGQPSVRHCHVIQYALDHFGYTHDDIVVILDGDMFPVRNINIKNLLKNTPLTGIRKYDSEENIAYLWVPFIAFDPRRLPNIETLKFNVSLINDILYDSGSESYHYIKNTPQIYVKMHHYYGSSTFFNVSPADMKKLGFNDNEITFIKTLPLTEYVEFHIKNGFLHFGASSFCLKGHDVKADCVKKFLEKILGE